MSQFTADTGSTFDAEPAEDLVQTITTAVADAEGVDPWELPPLYDAVDPDALHSLIRSGKQIGDRSPLEVSFRYAGYDVTVSGDGDVELDE